MSRMDKERLKAKVTGYKRFNASLERFLRTYGLVVVSQNAHVKVVRTDERGGSVIMPKTPSDRRSGLNTALQLIRLIEAC